MTATVGRVVRPRGEIRPTILRAMLRAQEKAERAHREYRDLVVDALNDGGSFAEVSKATGLSTNTLQRWKREAQ